MKIGIDIVDIDDFDKRIRRSGQNLLDKLFTPSELINQQITHLAGIFATKECLIKIGIIPLGEWKQVEIRNDNSGKPFVFGQNGQIITNVEISISHSPKSAVAVAILES